MARTTRITPEVLDERLSNIRELVQRTNEDLKEINTKLDTKMKDVDDLKTRVTKLEENTLIKNTRWVLGILIAVSGGKVAWDVANTPTTAPQPPATISAPENKAVTPGSVSPGE